MTAQEWYTSAKAKHEAQARHHEKRYNQLSWVRFILFIAVFSLIFLVFGQSLLLGGIGILVGIVVLLFFVRFHERHKKQQHFAKTKAEICFNELEYIQHHQREGHTGEEYAPKDHPYAFDLDVVGQGSLFTFLNTAQLAEGQARLAHWLLHPAQDDELQNRQARVRALSDHLDWMLTFRALSSKLFLEQANTQPLLSWANVPLPAMPIWANVVSFLLPPLFLAALIANLGGWVNALVPLGFAALHGFILSRTNKRVEKAHRQLSHIAPTLQTYSRLLQHLESAPFTAVTLQDLQQPLQQPVSAGKRVKQLARILQNLDLRYNVFGHLPLNWIFFWDIHTYRSLHRWHQQATAQLPVWLDLLAETEALIALSTLHAHFPEWAFAAVTDSYKGFQIEAAGHPLIHPDKRVDNDLTLSNSDIFLITGSNMAGKSTFLRTVGLNIVLGQAGAPVCASSASFPLTHLITSMRTFDSVNQSASSFYAELYQLQRVLQQVKDDPNTLFLVDEVLKGTNSADRHKGSVALLDQLVKAKATGLITTHDLELAEHFSAHPTVHNQSFEVEIEGEELEFDYKMRPGICHSFNATVLMKKMGIDVA